jgi:hypothetical protein
MCLQRHDAQAIETGPGLGFACAVHRPRMPYNGVMIIVHHLDNSRSQRVMWLREELGISYEAMFLNALSQGAEGLHIES